LKELFKERKYPDSTTALVYRNPRGIPARQFWKTVGFLSVRTGLSGIITVNHSKSGSILVGFSLLKFTVNIIH